MIMSVQLRILLMCRLELERNHAIDIRRLERLERYVVVCIYVCACVCVRALCMCVPGCRTEVETKCI